MIKKDYYHDDLKRGTPYDQKIVAPYFSPGESERSIFLCSCSASLAGTETSMLLTYVYDCMNWQQ